MPKSPSLKRSKKLSRLARKALQANERPKDIEKWAQELAESVADLTD